MKGLHRKRKNSDHLHQWQGDLWRMSQKLQSLGIVLELQGSECEGFPELRGMGHILSDLGNDLHKISTDLDEYLVLPES